MAENEKEIQLHTETSSLLQPVATGEAPDNNHDVESNYTWGGNNDNDNVPSPSGKHRLVDDVVDTFQLALPIFVSRVSLVGMKTTDTALLGHVSGRSLSAAALSDLWTMCSGVFLQGGVLGILVGQTVGAKNYDLAVIYLRISYLILGTISVLVMICYLFTEKVWMAMGQAHDIAHDAGYYSMVFVFSLPAQLGWNQLSQFYTAQRIMSPEMVASVIGLVCNLILGLVLVLGIPFKSFDGWGFEACPIVTAVVVWCQFVVLCGYYRRFGKERYGASSSSTQFSIFEGVTRERVRKFTELYFPAAFALASDFWRMGVIGAVAATLGETEVGLFNASYRVLWITLIFVGALSGASGIKIGLRLGDGDAPGAKQAGLVGIFLSLGCLVLLSVLVYFNTRTLGLVFTDDENYLDLFEECRLPFTCVLFFMNLSVGLEKIPLSMGRASEVFYSGFVASWFGQVLGVFLLTKYWRNDLYALYTGVALGYCVLVTIFGTIIYYSDWQKYSEIARMRAEASENKK
mmetsp:Transcript_3340/g.7099  ORF Transcript_3340/g.7099 Transcript_3340/m.7099 type:complete len:517 (+) Transcript_3340:48-1598(+)